MRIDDIRNMDSIRNALKKMLTVYMKDTFDKSTVWNKISDNITYCNDGYYSNDITPKKVKVYYTWDELDRLDLWSKVDWNSEDGKEYVYEDEKIEYVRFTVHQTWRYGGHDSYESKVKLTDLLASDRRSKIEKIQESILKNKGVTDVV